MHEVPRMIDNGNIGPVISTLVPRYSGETTFALLPRLRDLTEQGREAQLKIIGAPFDTGVSYRPGARFGPSHVRQSSRLLRPYNPATRTSPFSQIQVADAGDMALNPFDIAESIRTIEQHALELTEDDSSLLTIGGDHTIALPLLRAASTRAGQPVALLHFDAHLDTWDSYFGADYTHGTPFRRAAEEGLLDPEALCHIGTRGPLYSAQDLDDDARFGFGIMTSTEVMELGVSEVISQLRARIGERPLYISLDIDVLDPAHAPGTGTPEAGGMTSRELLAILRGLRGLNLIGADVVEVLPAYDHAELTGIAAAHACYELLTLMADLRVQAN